LVRIRNMTIKRNRNGSQKERTKKKKAILKAAEGLAGSRTVSPVGTSGVGKRQKAAGNTPPSARREKKRPRVIPKFKCPSQKVDIGSGHHCRELESVGGECREEHPRDSQRGSCPSLS
jgi:hypothetical protein